jgi:hypothetical protein
MKANEKTWLVLVMPMPGVTPTDEPSLMGPWTRNRAEAEAAEIRPVCDRGWL